MHYIQKYILDKLVYASYLRNKEMRPPRVESNLYQYHLKALIADGYIQKSPQGYSSAPKGLYYADRHSAQLKAERPQPKLVCIVVAQDARGRALVIQRAKQPFLGKWHLPSGKIHLGESSEAAIAREVQEKMPHVLISDLSLLGMAHGTITSKEMIISEYYGVIAKVSIGDYVPQDDEALMSVTDIEQQSGSFMPTIAELLLSVLEADKPFYEFSSSDA